MVLIGRARLAVDIPRLFQRRTGSNTAAAMMSDAYDDFAVRPDGFGPDLLACDPDSVFVTCPNITESSTASTGGLCKTASLVLFILSLFCHFYTVSQKSSYYRYSITRSLFYSRFKTFLFCKSFLLFFRIHYMDSTDCLLLLLSIFRLLLFSFFLLFSHFLVVGSVR